MREFMSIRGLNYTTIEDTTFSYGYSEDVLFFKSGKVAPAKISRKAYSEMLPLDDEKLSWYAYNNFEKKDIHLVKKAIYFAKTGIIVFFNMSPPKPREWIEPVINNLVKAALKRERIRIHGE
jgi:hypothetical protein